MEQIGKLAGALAKAQGAIKGAKKDAENPYFKSTYADLASVWEACRKALSDNELSIAQYCEAVEGGMVLKTTLMHSSGESITGSMPITVSDKTTAQQLGSIITYFRRYSLAAMVGVAPEDDDGNEANKATFEKPKSPAAKWAETPPKNSFNDELKTKATALVRQFELCETMEELTRVSTKNTELMVQIANKLPDWNARLIARIKEQEESLQGKSTV